MLSPDDVRRMARYNLWQNSQMQAALAPLDAAALRAERGAFFGSILGTLGHLLWGDGVWMSRLDGGDAPGGGIAQSATSAGSLADWWRARKLMDTRISEWAGACRAAGLGGDLNWYSGASGREMRRPLALCVAHMFNHQTHHRGQLHAMATAAGARGWVSDLVFMPEGGMEM